jgi:hypothetical protein
MYVKRNNIKIVHRFIAKRFVYEGKGVGTAFANSLNGTSQCILYIYTFRKDGRYYYNR